MASSATVRTFAVTHTEYDRLTDYMFRRLGRSRGRPTLRSLLRRAIWLALAITLLFSPYTIVLGILLFIALILIWSFTHWAAPLQKAAFVTAPKVPHTYEVTDHGFSVRTPEIFSEALWSQLLSWEEYQGVLRLGARDMLPVYLPVERLKMAGVYEDVLALARANDKRIATPGA
jgi:hypothetical protein